MCENCCDTKVAVLFYISEPNQSSRNKMQAGIGQKPAHGCGVLMRQNVYRYLFRPGLRYLFNSNYKIIIINGITCKVVFQGSMIGRYVSTNGLMLWTTVWAPTELLPGYYRQ